MKSRIFLWIFCMIIFSSFGYASSIESFNELDEYHNISKINITGAINNCDSECLLTGYSNGNLVISKEFDSGYTSFDIQTSSLNEGENEIYLELYDKESEEEYMSESQTIYVYTSRPTIRFNNLPSKTNEKDIDINFSTKRHTSVEITLNESKQTSEGKKHLVNFRNVPNGDHILNVTACDLANNCNTRLKEISVKDVDLEINLDRIGVDESGKLSEPFYTFKGNTTGEYIEAYNLGEKTYSDFDFNFDSFSNADQIIANKSASLQAQFDGFWSNIFKEDKDEIGADEKFSLFLGLKEGENTIVFFSYDDYGNFQTQIETIENLVSDAPFTQESVNILPNELFYEHVATNDMKLQVHAKLRYDGNTPISEVHDIDLDTLSSEIYLGDETVNLKTKKVDFDIERYDEETNELLLGFSVNLDHNSFDELNWQEIGEENHEEQMTIRWQLEFDYSVGDERFQDQTYYIDTPTTIQFPEMFFTPEELRDMANEFENISKDLYDVVDDVNKVTGALSIGCGGLTLAHFGSNIAKSLGHEMPDVEKW
ncbi:MAG: hypothetical protein ACOCP4_01305, partial [Candidatus Woesearchaeota archaeon]